MFQNSIPQTPFFYASFKQSNHGVSFYLTSELFSGKSLKFFSEIAGQTDFISLIATSTVTTTDDSYILHLCQNHNNLNFFAQKKWLLQKMCTCPNIDHKPAFRNKARVFISSFRFQQVQQLIFCQNDHKKNNFKLISLHMLCYRIKIQSTKLKKFPCLPTGVVFHLIGNYTNTQLSRRDNAFKLCKISTTILAMNSSQTIKLKRYHML